MKAKRVIQAIAAAMGAAALSAFAQAGSPTITLVTAFDYPNAAQTYPSAISDTDEITGFFVDATGAIDGFIRHQEGSYAPPLIVPHAQGTYANAINNSGLVVGYFYHKFDQGFFYRHGKFTTYNVPGPLATLINGVNNAGDFCGYYYDSKTAHAFINVGGNLSEISIPGAQQVAAEQLNTSDVVAGAYVAHQLEHGFYQDAKGVPHYPVDVPGAASTFLTGLNDENSMTGGYYDDAGVAHAVLFQPPNTFVTFDYPGATGSDFNNINRHGVIVGTYTDSAGNSHGFIAQLSQGN